MTKAPTTNIVSPLSQDGIPLNYPHEIRAGTTDNILTLTQSTGDDSRFLVIRSAIQGGGNVGSSVAIDTQSSYSGTTSSTTAFIPQETFYISTNGQAWFTGPKQLYVVSTAATGDILASAGGVVTIGASAIGSILLFEAAASGWNITLPDGKLGGELWMYMGGAAASSSVLFHCNTSGANYGLVGGLDTGTEALQFTATGTTTADINTGFYAVSNGAQWWLWPLLKGTTKCLSSVIKITPTS